MMSLTPDQFRKVGLGVTPSPSPFLTPRPERRRPESRGSDWNNNRHDRDKEVNVQVLLRCRPLSDEEQRTNIPKVISCNEHKKEVTVLQSVANKQVDRVFTFDKVFGPKAQQRSIYDQAIAPIVNEVLEGFNCTVFAYGQTGTGKTYTMEGGMRNKGGDLPAEAGVIPRAVRQIFDTLEAQNADYSMKVTFLELYNEEITDLLAPEDTLRCTDDRQKKPISLMEDGKGCVVVRGLEEEAVRSHSVFSITVHVKEASVGDEELIKCGKLNLVDLAGSENISRSGAREGRAREAGEINKSLLTLGRVINALVERSAHIPYRDSKLTRLLRDSLGGKTKTCIIATISPSAHSLEETLSTLDYAYRAKNIKNKPEANQKMSKAVLLKDLYLEIERMKEDVRAAREKNGVYVPHDRFVQDEAEKKARIEKIEQLENDLNLTENQVDRFRELYLTEQEQKLDIESELRDCKLNLEKNSKELVDLQENHKVAISTLKKKEFLISRLLLSENSLIARAKELRGDLQTASEDISSLFAKLVLATALLEAKEVIDHIQNLLDEQKQLVAVSARQQEEGLKRSLASSQVISKATVDFFNDLSCHASKVMTALQESQVKKIHQLADFEKMFKEEAAREEKQAFENIAEILAALTSRKTAMVSEISRNIQDLTIQEAKRFQQEMYSMQQVSSDAKEEISRYAEKAQMHFIEDTFSVAESRVAMENVHQECSKRVDYSWKQWGNTQSYINNFSKSSVVEIESAVKENISENHVAHEEFLSASSAMDVDFDSRTCDVLSAVDDSLIRDQESKKEMESITTLCLDQLKSIQEKHGQSIAYVRSEAEKYLTKDYLVDQHSGATPRRRDIPVPSLASIEEMRTPALENLKEEKK
ncbi:hypothetical protein GH714_011824 [Hevea brasiliensis]|uniref:Kinesin-like protein n=1 Tax=Hevea brasiliensis TaxID=3981 RepID=A0A6A6KL17_HEVBR|nr:hypothetical protein GH714_011824 [Hevea brasiliensis]